MVLSGEVFQHLLQKQKEMADTLGFLIVGTMIKL